MALLIVGDTMTMDNSAIQPMIIAIYQFTPKYHQVAKLSQFQLVITTIVLSWIIHQYTVGDAIAIAN